MVKFHHYVSFLTYTWHDKRALPAAMLSTKRKTLIRVMATRLHFIDNMFPASLNYFPLPTPMAPLTPGVAVRGRKKRLLVSSTPQVTSSLLRAERRRLWLLKSNTHFDLTNRRLYGLLYASLLITSVTETALAKKSFHASSLG